MVQTPLPDGLQLDTAKDESNKRTVWLGTPRASQKNSLSQCQEYDTDDDDQPGCNGCRPEDSVGLLRVHAHPPARLPFSLSVRTSTLSNLYFPAPPTYETVYSVLAEISAAGLAAHTVPDTRPWHLAHCIILFAMLRLLSVAAAVALTVARCTAPFPLPPCGAGRSPGRAPCRWRDLRRGRFGSRPSRSSSGTPRA